MEKNGQGSRARRAGYSLFNEGIEGSINDFQKRFPKSRSWWFRTVGSTGDAADGGAKSRQIPCGSGETWHRFGVGPLSGPAISAAAVDGSLILPEVTDKSKWWQGKHQYADPEGKYIFSHHASACILTWCRTTPSCETIRR